MCFWEMPCLCGVWEFKIGFCDSYVTNMNNPPFGDEPGGGF